MVTQRTTAPSGSGKQRISLPPISPPKGGGAVRGLGETFESQEFTGSAGFSIAIPAPYAREVAPDLSLTYSSSGGNGVFGVGAQVPLASIARQTSNGIPRYDDSDIFVLADQGELVPALIWDQAAGKWIADRRTEHIDLVTYDVVVYRVRDQAPLAGIERWTRRDNGEAYWRVLGRDNILQTFGRTAESRIFDPARPNRVFQWLLDESQDPMGNRIVYFYKPEDSAKVSRSGSEAGGDHSANRYLSRIEYGNYFAGGEEHFAFRIVFDYGEFSLAHPDDPGGTWEPRPDPFSTYRSGFEIRTLRRCANILIYHCFHDQFDGRPFLTKSLSLTYRQSNGHSSAAPNLSLLASVMETGWRRQADGTYQTLSTPEILFEYTPFQPLKQPFEKLEFDGGMISGYPDGGEFVWMDTDGEGIPGLLYSDGTVTLQWDPLGGGRYSGPHHPSRFPTDRDLSGGAVSITSLSANGELDLVVTAPSRSGFYPHDRGGAWGTFRPFRSMPVEASSPLATLVDMNGSGKADLAVFDNALIRSYPSLGEAGFGAPDLALAQPGFPTEDDPGEQELLTFADMFGDGLSHRVRIRDGMVECWPNLGYGNFGERVVLGNAPVFGEDFDARRLFLVDVDGTGMADLVYASPGHIRIYFNQSGNSFSDPLVLPLPAPYFTASQISFADVKGNGTSCLVMTCLSPTVTHYFYDFSGDVKPYLLSGFDNNMGTRTRITYSTSVKQYLEDKAGGRPWAARMFFPVPVIDKVEKIDAISATRYVTRYKYHDGYYDPVEREFRGFGFVETWDSEEYEQSVAAARASATRVEVPTRDQFVAPTYARTWYDLGDFGAHGRISRQYAREYWRGDPLAANPPEAMFDPAIDWQDPETVRQAYVMLSGRMLRQEVYGLDDSPAAANPFTVSQSISMVRQVQPRNGQPYAVFFTDTAESISYHYDRDPADPRIQHDFNLVVDEFGNILRSCSVAYPRRLNTGKAIYPEQVERHVVVSEDRFINHQETSAEPYRWIGIPCEMRQYEVEGIASSGYFSFSDLALQIAAAMKNPLAYGQPFTPGQRQARLFSWERGYYWDSTQAAALPLGGISARGLEHHVEQAVLTPDLVQTAFGDRLTAKQIAGDAGYWLDQDYWWNRGLILYYLKNADEFFLPCRTGGDFVGVDLEAPLNPTSTVAYDAYSLLPVSAVEYLRGMPVQNPIVPPPVPVTLVVRAENDYQALSPWRITDANGNVDEALYDPMGRVVVTTAYGIEEGRAVGDLPLSSYQPVTNPDFNNVIADPPKYLQNASSFFFYDLLAWCDRWQPVSAVGLQRQTYVRDLEPGETSIIDVHITYADGFGRVIEQKLKADPGPLVARDANGAVVREPSGAALLTAGQRWIASGRTVFNNKALPAREYFPFYSPTPDYETLWQCTQPGLVPPPAVLFYDAINRLIRTDTPKGFFSKVEFSPWETRKFDEDDTVKDSTYYKNFPTHPTTPAEKNEKDALDKAAAFYNTPEIEILDTLGRTVRVLQNNLGAVRVSDLEPIVAGSGETARQLFDQLIAYGYLRTDGQDPAVAWVTETVRPYSADFQARIHREFPAFAGPLLAFLKTNGLTTLRELDIAGHEVRVTDPRLLYENVTLGSDFHNAVNLLDMSGNVLVEQNADSGLTRSLHNIFARLWWNLTPRNFEQTVEYDRLFRRLKVRVKGLDNSGTVVTDTLAEVYTYGETQSDSENRNLRGRLYELRDQSGLLTDSLYGLRGDPLRTTRQFTVHYKEPIDWASDVPLQKETYQSDFAFNELGQPVSETPPDRSAIRTSYNQAGQVAAISVAFPDGISQTILQKIDYNANGDRVSVLRGNGTLTAFEYEATTLRLLRLSSTRPDVGPNGAARAPLLQDISYTYDPVGNVTRVYDATYQAVFHNNQKVEPLSGYTYDALYRVIEATGRQHSGITATTWRNNSVDGDFKQSKFFPLPNDGNALENYRESYGFDDAGNLTGVSHQATNSWSRTQQIMPDSNRLKSVSARNGPGYSYPISYDNAGNQRQLDINSPVNLTWNCCDNLVSARIITRPSEPDDSDYYTYDSDELRTRKISERLVNHGSATEVETTFYLGNYEVKRVERAGGPVTLERQCLRILDDGICAATIFHWVQDDHGREVPQPGTRSTRYQLDNLLRSVSLELSPDAEIISYEEYFPFGGTSYLAGPSRQEVARKDYRYMGKECDDSTGLYYFGARYYASWLGRWLKPDPAGPVDGLNLYAFVAGNPLRYSDPSGYSKKTAAKKSSSKKSSSKTSSSQKGISKSKKTKKSVDSKYFTSSGGTVKGKAKARPTNQNGKGPQQKIAERLENASVTLPQHMTDYIDDVNANGKADLTGLGLDICHVTSADTMKETTAEAISQRDTLSKKDKRKYEEAIEETISSDEEEDRKRYKKKARKMLDPNTPVQESLEIGDELLTRVNKASRNLRPDHNRTNRGIGKNKDAFIVGKKEESRSRGINDKWNNSRDSLGLKKDVPRTKDVGGQTLIKSSSVDPVPKNAFITPPKKTFQL